MMRIEITRPDGDLKREVWEFTLSGYIMDWCIYFDAYKIQTRGGNQSKKWTTQTNWYRLNHNTGYNDIDNPPLPNDVEAELRSRLKDYTDTITISGRP